MTNFISFGIEMSVHFHGIKLKWKWQKTVSNDVANFMYVQLYVHKCVPVPAIRGRCAETTRSFIWVRVDQKQMKLQLYTDNYNLFHGF